jgi:hypothetical protein
VATKPLLKDFGPADISRVARELDETGFVCLPDIIDPKWIEDARAQVDASLEGRGFGVFTVLHPGKIANSPTQTLATNPAIQKLMVGLAEHSAPAVNNDNEDVYTVLRVVGGGSKERVVPLFHYDSSTITVLVPIYIPQGEEGFCGDLVVFPNKRRHRKFVFSNIFEKMIVQSRAYNHRVLHKLMAGNREEIKVLNPGNIYLFWGYRSYHGNFGCSPDALRATLLLHFGNPHGNSGILRFVRAFRIWRIKQVAKKANAL